MSTTDVAANTALPTYTKKDFESGVDPALVPGLRRLLDHQPGAAAHADRRREAREHRLHLRHRLQLALPVLHEQLRDAHDPRPRADLRLGPQDLAPRAAGLDRDRRRRRARHRRQPLHPRDAAEHWTSRCCCSTTASTASRRARSPRPPSSARRRRRRRTARRTTRSTRRRSRIGAGATFVARTIDIEGPHMAAVLKAAAAHKGSTFVEIYQNCPVFNDGAYEFLTDKAVKADAQLRMEHGKPLALRQGQQEGHPPQRRDDGPRGRDPRRERRDREGHPRPRREARGPDASRSCSRTSRRARVPDADRRLPRRPRCRRSRS